MRFPTRTAPCHHIGVDECGIAQRVKLRANNPGGELLGGAYCRVDFADSDRPNMVRLLATALLLVNRGVQVGVLTTTISGAQVGSIRPEFQ
jgi:hypothetical protein